MGGGGRGRKSRGDNASLDKFNTHTKEKQSLSRGGTSFFRSLATPDPCSLFDCAVKMCKFSICDSATSQVPQFSPKLSAFVRSAFHVGYFTTNATKRPETSTFSFALDEMNNFKFS